MDDLKAQLFDLAVRDLPRSFVRDMQRLLPQVYREAHARSFTDPAWDEPEGHDVCGHVRRALTEKAFRKSAQSAGLHAHPYKNPGLTSFYTLVRAGNLLLTQSAIQFEWQMARPAMFRSQHAAVNRILMQPVIPGLGIETPNLDDGEDVYSILFHGPQLRNPRELGFAVIGFPYANSHRTAYKFSLDLIAKAQAGQSVTSEEISDQVKPKFRRKKDTGDQ